MMELQYLWRFALDRKPWRIPELLLDAMQYKKSRGMNYMTDVRDWLGGWPMEFCKDADVVEFVTKQAGMALMRMRTGEANTEFLFQRHILE
jgi:2-polyprenyl-6-hydroxyphenyl methylase/3-demethylubiquinone-9 3-methyltransferase